MKGKNYKRVNNLIKNVKRFNIKNVEAPLTIKLVLGQCPYLKTSKNTPNYISLNNSRTTQIEDYKNFKDVAFFNESQNIKDSEIMFVALLLGSFDYALYFVKKLKASPTLLAKFIDYLYYEKGIVLVNRYKNTANYKKINEEVSDLLIIGSENMGLTIKNFILNKNIKNISQVLHCSSRNVSKGNSYFNAWYYHQEDAFPAYSYIDSNKVSHNFNKVNIKDFLIL